MHAFVAPFRMSSTLIKPDATAASADRRAADQNAILCAAQQKRFGEPPRRAINRPLHHRHTGNVIIKNYPAVAEGSEPPELTSGRLVVPGGSARAPAPIFGQPLHERRPIGNVLNAGQPMAPAAIGRRRPDRLNDDQALGVDDLDEEETFPWKPGAGGIRRERDRPYL